MEKTSHLVGGEQFTQWFTLFYIEFSLLGDKIDEYQIHESFDSRTNICNELIL